MQYSQEHLKTMVYAEFGGQTECIMGNSKIENFLKNKIHFQKKKKKKKHHSTKTNMDWKVSFTQENQPMRKYQQDLYVFS